MVQIPVWDNAYRRMLPRIERAFILRAPTGRMQRWAILGFKLWFRRSRVSYLIILAENTIPAEARGRARRILNGEEVSLFSKVYSFVLDAFKTGEYDESEARDLVETTLAFFKEHEDIDSILALSLLAQITPVEVTEDLYAKLKDAIDMIPELRGKAGKLLGERALSVGDEMDDYLVFIVNKPVFKVVKGVVGKEKKKRRRRRGKEARSVGEQG